MSLREYIHGRDHSVIRCSICPYRKRGRSNNHYGSKIIYSTVLFYVPSPYSVKVP